MLVKGGYFPVSLVSALFSHGLLDNISVTDPQQTLLLVISHLETKLGLQSAAVTLEQDQMQAQIPSTNPERIKTIADFIMNLNLGENRSAEGSETRAEGVFEQDLSKLIKYLTILERRGRTQVFDTLSGQQGLL